MNGPWRRVPHKVAEVDGATVGPQRVIVLYLVPGKES